MSRNNMPALMEGWCREAIGFLLKQYREADDPDVKSAIASVPNGRYGVDETGSCDAHTDMTTHFDLPR